MRELLSKQNLDYQDRAREVAEKYVRPRAAELDRTGEYGWEILEALKAYGLTGIWIPKEYGGQGSGVLDMCLVVEQLSRACGGVGVAYAVNALGSFPIILGGTLCSFPYPRGARPARVAAHRAIRLTSSPKDIPAARAAIGRRLCEVNPGMVFSSSTVGAPRASSMMSALPKSLAPSATKAESAIRCISSRAASSSSAGHT